MMMIAEYVYCIVCSPRPTWCEACCSCSRWSVVLLFYYSIVVRLSCSVFLLLLCFMGRAAWYKFHNIPRPTLIRHLKKPSLDMGVKNSLADEQFCPSSKKRAGINLARHEKSPLWSDSNWCHTNSVCFFLWEECNLKYVQSGDGIIRTKMVEISFHSSSSSGST